MNPPVHYSQALLDQFNHLGFPDAAQMDVYDASGSGICFLAFLQEKPLGASEGVDAIDFIFGCIKLSDAELGNIECISAWPIIFDIQESRLSTCNVEYWRDDGPFPSKDGILAAVIDKISARCIL